MTTPAGRSADDDLSLPPGVDWIEPQPGLAAVRVDRPEVQATVYQQGAHLTRWSTGGREHIFVSAHTRYSPGTAIRGGIPVCLPWFGAGSSGQRSPSHGYARITPWELTDADVIEDGVRLGFTLDTRDRTDVAERFVATLTYRIGATLAAELAVTASGDLSLQQALHSYLTVDDIEAVALEGLAGANYLDKTTGQRVTQDGPLRLVGATDRVYDSPEPVILVVAGQPVLRVDKARSANTVVWNPWSDGAAELADLGAEEWRRFVCVEVANVEPEIVLAAGESHVLFAELTPGCVVSR